MEAQIKFEPHLGFQDQSIIKLVTQARPGSVFDDPYMDGKLIRYGSQCKWSHVKSPSVSTGIIKTSQRPESAMVLRHRLLVRWTVYRVWTD